MTSFLKYILWFFLLGVTATQGKQIIVTSGAGIPMNGVEPFEINVENLHSGLTATGYTPIRVTINNRIKADKNFIVFAKFKDSSYQNDHNATTAKFYITAPAGQIKITDLLVPSVYGKARYGNPESHLSITVSSAGLNSIEGEMSRSYSKNWPSLLMSEALHTRYALILDKEVEKALGSHRSGQTVFANSFESQSAAENWKAYSGYRSILITAEEWRDLSPSAKNAIKEWLRLSGHLQVFDQTGSLSLKQLGLEKFTSKKVELTTTPQNYKLDAPKLVKKISKQFTHVVADLEDFSQKSWSLSKKLGVKSFQPVLFIIFLIAFGIIVGPVNLFVWAKSGRRHRLFITTPLISIGASLLLLVVILFQDGFGGKGYYRSHILVHAAEGENQLYVTQEQMSRTGVLLGSQFESDNSQVMSQIPLNDSRWARVSKAENTSNRYDYRFSKKGKTAYSGNWFQSRSEQAHLIHSIIPSRERIEIVSGGDTPQAVSTFQFAIENFYFQDSQGNFWKADLLQQGQKTSLEPSSEKECLEWCLVNVAGNSSFLLKGKKSPEKFVPEKAHFIASVPEAPHIKTLSAVKWKALPSLLQGTPLTR